MKYYFHNKPLKYDGSQLSPLFAYKNFNVRGDSVVAFQGPCFVKEHMVDVEDVIAGEHISSKNMLHFIVEVFKSPPSLAEARMLQLLIVEAATNFLRESFQCDNINQRVHHSGDDIFLWDGKKKCKMSVSIATVSGSSYLIHFAINLVTKDIPKGVNAGSLADWNTWTGCEITSRQFADAVGSKVVEIYDEDIIPALNKAFTV